MQKIKTLVIDDSAVVRSLLKQELGKRPDIEIVDTAPDPYIARDRIVQLNPDVVTLDIEMPRMDGITFLERLMKSHPMPVVILSTLTTSGCSLALKALDLGAVEVMHKPSADVAGSLHEMMEQIANAIRAGYAARHRFTSVSRPRHVTVQAISSSGIVIRKKNHVVAIGASTGGTEALRVLLPQLPVEFPGIVLAQHMPGAFTRSFAESLSAQCAMEVCEAKEGDFVQPGRILIAPGNYHMVLKRAGERYAVEIKSGPLVFYQRPSVEVLFDSVARAAGANAVGVLLTGMGRDGAMGLLHMKDAGARTIAQDEESCVVFGMPKAAIEIGAVDQVVSLEAIAGELVRLVA